MKNSIVICVVTGVVASGLFEAFRLLFITLEVLFKCEVARHLPTSHIYCI